MYLILTGLLVVMIGCISQQDNEVVVYSALDREFSEPILNDLQQELEFSIRAKYDQESNKTVGLANELLQMKNRPVADIFWNNEILHTLRLQQAGVLEIYQPPNWNRFPDHAHSATGTWSGFAARARILIVNTDLLPDSADRPNSIYDLANPKWEGKCAIARPVFGTTATHASVLIAELGKQPGHQLWSDIASNAVVVGGNKQVAQGVASGRFAFGLTDTDDAMVEIENANPVTIVFPDQADGQLGTLVIPNTLALIKNSPNALRARQLINRLLQADIEQRLASGPSAQMPLGTMDAESNPWRVLKHSNIDSLDKLKLMKVDFDQAAGAWETSKEFLSGLGR